jgi:hypothetical protein
VTGCPLRIVPAETFGILDLAELMKEGLPPVAGGVLDQAKTFLDAARLVWAEEERWRQKQAEKKRQ